jgi:hypothetical protein
MTPGERWASEELRALRAAGFRPRAWQRFLEASFDRAADSRRAYPALTRQARAWSGTALLAGHAARRAARSRGLAAPSAPAWTAWSLTGAAMLDWHLGMLEGPHGERRDRLRAADALTLSRCWLAPFVAATTAGAPFSTLIAAAGATDYLDGRLARRSGPTRLGRDLDTIADVAVKLAAARAARRAGWLTPDTTCLLAGCQLAGVTAVAGAYFRTGRSPAGVAAARWVAPPLLGGVALAPHAPGAANRLVRAASLATLIIALPRHTPSDRREHGVLGPPRRRQRAPATHARLAQPQRRRVERTPRAVPHHHVRPLCAHAQRARGDGRDGLARK